MFGSRRPAVGRHRCGWRERRATIPQPERWRRSVLPIELRSRKLDHGDGVEPPTSRFRAWRSAAELTVKKMAPLEGFEPPASRFVAGRPIRWASGVKIWYRRRDSNSQARGARRSERRVYAVPPRRQKNGALARIRIWIPMEGSTISGSRVCLFHHERVVKIGVTDGY